MKLVTTGPLPGGASTKLAGEHHEAGRVVLLVLDVLGEDLQAVDLRGQRREIAAWVGSPNSATSRAGAGGVAGDDRLEPVLADDLAALPQRVDVAVHGADRVQARPGHPHQAEPDPQEVLPDDVQPGVGQEVVDVRDPAGDRVVDRDHRQSGLTGLDGGEDVLERRARHGLPPGSAPCTPGGSWRRVRPGRRCGSHGEVHDAVSHGAQVSLPTVRGVGARLRGTAYSPSRLCAW